MNSGSWSSYQSALPNEARAGGEPDDEPTDTRMPIGYLVSWTAWETVPLATEWGETYQQVPSVGSRWFDPEPWRLKHARAWCAAMERRHGRGNVMMDAVFEGDLGDIR